MKHRWLITVLYIGTFGTSFNAAIPIQNEYFAIREHTSENRESRDAEGNTDELNASVEIKEMYVHSEIALRYASTSVVTHVHNPGRWSQEYQFHVLLPESAFVTGFTMILDGKSYKAYVKEKDEAKEIYSEAVSRGVGAAHVATKVRDSNHFTVTVNVEGNSTAIFDLRYEEFLVRRNEMYNHVINLYPGAFVPKMEVVVHIKESQKITKLLVPEVRTGNEIDATAKDRQNSEAVIEKGKTSREVTITFTPDLSEQERLAKIYADKTRDKSSLDKFIGYTSDEEENDQNTKVLGQFVVQYDVNRSNNDEILVNDGYFVHFLTPTSLPPLSKHVVFVLDTSSSMAGRKIVQLRNAMETIISDLNSKDYFSIVEFNTDVKVHDLKDIDDVSFTYRYTFNHDTTLISPAKATPQNIAKAKVIISKLRASRATNIDKALKLALNIVKKGVNYTNEADSSNQDIKNKIDVANCNNETEEKEVEPEPVIIFLTDGDPTVGILDTKTIISHVTELNIGVRKASLYSLAFGEAPDRNFLRQLSLRNDGYMRHIYEAADAALQLHNFYREVSSPLLAHVQFLYPSKQIKEGTISRNEFRTIHEGSEVAVVGQIAEDATELTPQVLAYRSDDDGIGRKRYDVSSSASVNHTKDEYFPLERLWAYLSVKQLLDKSIAEDYSGSYEDSPAKKALDIALKYGFVTPLTSLVVVKANETKSLDEEKNVKRSSIDPYSRMLMMPPSEQSIRTGISTHDVNKSFKLDFSSDISTLVVFQSKKTGRTRTKISDVKIEGVKTRQEINNNLQPSMRLQSFVPPTKDVSTDFIMRYIHEPATTTTKIPIIKMALDGRRPSRPLDFRWIDPIFKRHSLSLEFEENGTQVVLKVERSFFPLKVEDNEVECLNSVSVGPEVAAGVNEISGNVCVYFTRCYAARTITVDEYKKSYCVVKDSYAGICCPRSEVES